MTPTQAAAIAALKSFGVAYRALGETDPETVRLWHIAIKAQRVHRDAQQRQAAEEVG